MATNNIDAPKAGDTPADGGQERKTPEITPDSDEQRARGEAYVNGMSISHPAAVLVENDEIPAQDAAETRHREIVEEIERARADVDRWDDGNVRKEADRYARSAVELLNEGNRRGALENLAEAAELERTDWTASEKGPTYSATVAQLQFAIREDREAGLNVVEEVRPRSRYEEIDVPEALEAARKLRERDREEIEAGRTRMQDRTEAEQHRVKGLDQEARRLDKSNELAERAGVDGDYGRQVSTEAEKNRRIEVMEQVTAQFRVSGPHYHFKDQPSKVAFRDAGTRLKSASNDSRVARAMAMMADAKGWKTINVSGHPDFQREVWLEASLRGLEVRGFKPQEQDLKALDALRERQMRNSIEPAPERERGKGRSEAQEAARTEPAPETGRTRETRSEASVRAYTGILLEHGHAPYKNDPAEKPSYFVKLATEAGERTVWGKDLERAISGAGVGRGDAVSVAYRGEQPVTVDALKRDDKGKVIGTERIDTKRNEWEVKKTDRAIVVEAVAKALFADRIKNPADRELVTQEFEKRLREREAAGTVPPVRMFDKTAPSQVRDAERVRPQVERNAERVR